MSNTSGREQAISFIFTFDNREGRVMVELEKYKKRGISKAFTLLELLAVIVILSIISTITVPIFANKKEDARNIADKQNTIELKKAANRYMLDHNINGYIDITDKLVSEGYIREIPKDPYGNSNASYKVYINEKGQPKVASLNNNLIAQIGGSISYNPRPAWLDSQLEVVYDPTCPIGDGYVLKLKSITEDRAYTGGINITTQNGFKAGKKYILTWYDKGNKGYYKDSNFWYTDNSWEFLHGVAGRQNTSLEWIKREIQFTIGNPSDGKVYTHMHLPRFFLYADDDGIDDIVYFSPFILYEIN